MSVRSNLDFYKKISAAEMVKILYQQQKQELLLIKLFDRLHNIQTVGAKPPEKGRKIILETLQFFLTVATYLKIPNVTRQLHTHCLNIIANYKKLNLYKMQYNLSLFTHASQYGTKQLS